jgi:hypothetical protein
MATHCDVSGAGSQQLAAAAVPRQCPVCDASYNAVVPLNASEQEVSSLRSQLEQELAQKKASKKAGKITKRKRPRHGQADASTAAGLHSPVADLSAARRAASVFTVGATTSGSAAAAAAATSVAARGGECGGERGSGSQRRPKRQQHHGHSQQQPGSVGSLAAELRAAVAERLADTDALEVAAAQDLTQQRKVSFCEDRRGNRNPAAAAPRPHQQQRRRAR